MPDFLSWTAFGEGYDEIADIEARVQDIECLEHPVKAVTPLGAEDTKHEEDDGDFGEAS